MVNYHTIDSTVRIRWIILATLMVLGTFLHASAQTPSPPAQDPIMSLLLSQPKIELDAPVKPVATFDPPVVRPGQKAIYRVVFNALEESIEWPKKVPAPPQLDMHAGAHGQILQMAGTNMEARTTFNLHLRVSTVGEFTVPEYTVKVYAKPVTVPAAQLSVVANPPPSVPPAQELFLDVPTTNLYVGQAVRVGVMLPSMNGTFQTLAQVQLTGDGILVDQTGARQRVQPVPRLGLNLPTFIHDALMTPLKAGKITFYGQAYAVGNRFQGVVISGNPGVLSGLFPYTLLDSEPVEIQVRPLPAGALAGFTGAVGTFTNDPPKLATNVVRVGDPVKLSVVIRGTGNVARLVPPEPPNVRDWQVFSAPGDSIPPQIIHAQGAVTFNYSLIPLTSDTSATPAIPFSYFDPETGRYQELTIPPVSVTVRPGAQVADLEALRQPDPVPTPSEKEPRLSGLAASPGITASSLEPIQGRAWFPLIQLAPAAAFIGLWGWDRRRRYLEKHPEILMRRRALRALRRERRAMRHAARASDASSFASASVRALRAASAPYFPAEPNALVGADVLQLVQTTDRSDGAGEVVRRLFTATDAARFGAAQHDPAELLALQPTLERLLEEMEERLCD